MKGKLQADNHNQRSHVDHPILIQSLGSVLTLVVLLTAAQTFLRLGLPIYTEQVLALILGMGIALCFLHSLSCKKKPSTIRIWADRVFAFLGLAVGCYLLFRYPILAQEYFYRKTEAIIIGVVLIPLAIEGLRRMTGLGLVSVVLLFIVYAFFADKVPGTLQGRAVSLGDMLSYLTVDNIAIFGLPLKIIATVVLAFIFFGQILLITGAAEWFTDLSTAVVGGTRGGAAKISVVASGLFGSISGSAVSNVASTGVITIPLMKKGGFSGEMAAAFESVASTGGQIMPPIMGAAAFLIAEFLQLPYASVVAGAVFPSLLFYFAILLQADLEAARLNVKPLDTASVPKLRHILAAGWYFPIPFILLVAVLFLLNLPPAEAALWSAGCMIALNLLFGRKVGRITPRALFKVMVQTGKGSIDIILVGAAAGMIIGLLEITGLSFGLTHLMVVMGKNNQLLMLIATAAICIILGMGMPTTGIYVLVATLAAPPMIELGVNPLGAHLFVLYFGLMSMITPPMAIAAFTAAGIANTGFMQAAFASVKVGWIAFIIPFLFIYSPELLLDGSVMSIMVAVLSTAVGIVFISAAFIGYINGRLGPVARILLFIIGCIVLISHIKPSLQIIITFLGLIGIVLLYLQGKKKRIS
ncbi:MAG: TRAP transporter fused permease subunit [Desulfobacteraceae bacterium]|nr:TRAP transporter fused permease subunit [Desulfobacteraceae bacterium]